jgi:hypothetical protein
MAITSITGMTAIIAANLTDNAVLMVDEAGGDTRKATIDQLRTQIFNKTPISFPGMVNLAGGVGNEFQVLSRGFGLLLSGGQAYVRSDVSAQVTIMGGAANSPALIVGNGVVATQKLVPEADNTWSLGEHARRYSVVYAVNGVIQTSRAVEKKIERRIGGAEALASIRKLPVYAYTYNDDPGYLPANSSARVPHRHVGVTIEELPQWARTTDEGVNPMAVASLAIAGVHGLDTIVAQLLERINQLEKRLASSAAVEPASTNPPPSRQP